MCCGAGGAKTMEEPSGDKAALDWGREKTLRPPTCNFLPGMLFICKPSSGAKGAVKGSCGWPGVSLNGPKF